MIPFVRTLEEGRKVVEVLEQNGLKQGENGLKIIMMCEVPSNALLADEFLEIFDGFSIGSNDLTQLSLGLDRDSSIVAHLFDERNPAVKKLLSMAIKAARQGQVRRHLRPGPVRSPGSGRMADAGRHRVGVAEPGHRGRYLAAPGQAEGQRLMP
jgi:pyruvate,water dikinase